MSIRVALQHKTHYHYNKPVTLSPHLIRLHPASHSRTPIVSYSLNIAPEKHFINWQQDTFGNHVARIVFPEKVKSFEIDVEVIADMTVINPFDFFIEPSAEKWPFKYDKELKKDLSPYLKITESGKKLNKLVNKLNQHDIHVVDFLVSVNQSVQKKINYTVRMEHGVQSCEETLSLKSGSCRDSAWLLVQIFRHMGLAARFVSGYLVQLSSDEKSLDGPSGPEQDFTDLHAWTEVFIPGAGWLGLDPTSGLFAGEGHIPLCCTPYPESAAPITGMAEPCETTFDFSNNVIRIHEDPRVTKPYSDEQWSDIMKLGNAIDAQLKEQDVRLTQGGEPTFVSIDDYDAPQWNTTALGEDKEALARELLKRLAKRFTHRPVLHHGQGKWYPGEELPRWAFTCYFREDKQALWHNPHSLSPIEPQGATLEDAEQFIKVLSEQLQLDKDTWSPAFENAEHYLQYEASLPEDINPEQSDLDDPLERRRLACILNRGLNNATGYVLPLQWNDKKDHWHSAAWKLRSEKIVLLPGDSSMGYRLPLASLPEYVQKHQRHIERDPFDDRDPLGSLHIRSRETINKEIPAPQFAGDESEHMPYTALCAEPRDGRLWVFMPPMTHLEHWLELIGAIEHAANTCGVAVDLEGYEAPSDPRINKFAITPDPGVIEVNIHPSSSWKDLVSTNQSLYEEARLTRLGTEKFMIDGRHTGTGGGNHMTLGGKSPADSPFLRRPDLLASLLVFWQNHPALSYLFSGLFVGPTSQAPRIDEARNDSLYELDIALSQITRGEVPEPWQVDRIFRNILVDVTGNTHRAEFCIDKLYSPSGTTGRLGLLELRAFEMPPHWQMNLAQSLLLRALVACFWNKPYTGKPIHWGTAIHDRFMLPYYIKRDLNDVIDYLNEEGFAFDAQWYDTFMEFRFPYYGNIEKSGMVMSLHSAIEPWHVLGEETTATGTSRYVDSSVERLQITISNFNSERYSVYCNEQKVPMQRTDTAGEFVSGIRFKAWQPPHGLHPLLGRDASLTFDIVDNFNQKSIGGCTYHVEHPSGRNYETLPVNANEAEARRIARFWEHGHSTGRFTEQSEKVHPMYPCTLDLRFSR